jgi:DtxR family transcriptional regulator, Mn-dependent transcriptional regulator
MVKNKENVSAAMQEYLAVAYRLSCQQEDSVFVSTSALAQAMGVSAPAVTRMVQRLKDRSFLEHQLYQGISLTPEGIREALANIRRHRLVERFLVDVMRFEWYEVHDVTDDFEPVVADIVVKRMEEMAGKPRRCPHGEPIPTEDGTMPAVRDTALAEVEIGAEYVISRVMTHDAEKLKYLGVLGLKPGATFQLVERAPFEGPLQLRVGEQTHFIGEALANVLRVCSQKEFDAV